jgi:uncharacterized protein (TIGR03067 family)
MPFGDPREDTSMRHLGPVVVLASLISTMSLSNPSALAQDKPALAWEYRAASVGADEKEATKKLNALAAEGWEPVCPLGNGLVAFRRSLPSAAETAARKELARLQGEWENGPQTLIIKGDSWRWGNTGKFTLEEFKDNRIKIVGTRAGVIDADLSVAEGEMKGQTCKAIFRLEGDTLRYCGSYDVRPTGFDDGSGFAVEWKHVKK